MVSRTRVYPGMIYKKLIMQCSLECLESKVVFLLFLVSKSMVKSIYIYKYSINNQQFYHHSNGNTHGGKIPNTRASPFPIRVISLASSGDRRGGGAPITRQGALRSPHAAHAASAVRIDLVEMEGDAETSWWSAGYVY